MNSRDVVLKGQLYDNLFVRIRSSKGVAKRRLEEAANSLSHIANSEDDDSFKVIQLSFSGRGPIKIGRAGLEALTKLLLENPHLERPFQTEDIPDDPIPLLRIESLPIYSIDNSPSKQDMFTIQQLGMSHVHRHPYPVGYAMDQKDFVGNLVNYHIAKLLQPYLLDNKPEMLYLVARKRNKYTTNSRGVKVLLSSEYEAHYIKFSRMYDISARPIRVSDEVYATIYTETVNTETIEGSGNFHDILGEDEFREQLDNHGYIQALILIDILSDFPDLEFNAYGDIITRKESIVRYVIIDEIYGGNNPLPQEADIIGGSSEEAERVNGGELEIRKQFKWIRDYTCTYYPFFLDLDINFLVHSGPRVSIFSSDYLASDKKFRYKRIDGKLHLSKETQAFLSNTRSGFFEFSHFGTTDFFRSREKWGELGKYLFDQAQSKFDGETLYRPLRETRDYQIRNDPHTVTSYLIYSRIAEKYSYRKKRGSTALVYHGKLNLFDLFEIEEMKLLHKLDIVCYEHDRILELKFRRIYQEQIVVEYLLRYNPHDLDREYFVIDYGINVTKLPTDRSYNNLPMTRPIKPSSIEGILQGEISVIAQNENQSNHAVYYGNLYICTLEQFFRNNSQVYMSTYLTQLSRPEGPREEDRLERYVKQRDSALSRIHSDMTMNPKEYYNRAGNALRMAIIFDPEIYASVNFSRDGQNYIYPIFVDPIATKWLGYDANIQGNQRGIDRSLLDGKLNDKIINSQYLAPGAKIKVMSTASTIWTSTEKADYLTSYSH